MHTSVEHPATCSRYMEAADYISASSYGIQYRKEDHDSALRYGRHF